MIPFFLFNPFTSYGRSNNRRSSLQRTPHLKVTLDESQESTTHGIRSDRLQEHPLFHTFEKDFFYENLLPEKSIAYRDKMGAVPGKVLNTLIENLLVEIREGKKKFTDFIVLGSKNFNKRNQYGLLILKFRDYPFVFKLFIETPASFVDPYTKGLESLCFFFMGGGVNRHIMGFTRIKNLQTVREKIYADPVWSQRVDVPRKWFWLPQSPQWLKLEGEHIAYPGQRITTTIPAMYGIVAEAIDASRKFSILNGEDKKLALELSNFLEIVIDAHIDNFMVEKNTNKVVIVDTEYFPMLVGMREGRGFKNYFDYFSTLTLKFLKDTFGYTKKERQAFRACRPPSAKEFSLDISKQTQILTGEPSQTNQSFCYRQKSRTTSHLT